MNMDAKVVETADKAIDGLLDALYGVLSETGDIRRYCSSPAKLFGAGEVAKEALAKALEEEKSKRTTSGRSGNA